jgi:hypothetical protein
MSSDAEREREFAFRDKWLDRAKAVSTEDELAALVRDVLAEPQDYGTCVYSTAACALAGATLASKKLGITGFQAGCVMWEFVQRWLHIEGPARLVRYHDMLYPQNAEKFVREIDSETAEYLKTEARKVLAGDAEFMHPAVKEHLERVAEGWVPFGFAVKPEAEKRARR